VADAGAGPVRTAGAIYDLGYQRYTGTRLGRANAVRTLVAYSMRTAFGLGRGARAKFVPIFCGAIILLPAIAQIVVASTFARPETINYAQHLEISAFLLALFTAAQSPELLVTDRQQGVLTLYLSRPLRGTDYMWAKLMAMIGAMLLMTLGPQLFLFVGKVFAGTAPWAALQTEYTKLAPIVAGCVLVACLFASLGLALSSFASRRAFASATVVAVFLFLPAATTLIRSFTSGDLRRYILLANPIHLMTGFVNWLFEIEVRRRSTLGRAEIEGTTFLYVMLAMCAACVAVLYLRYRRAQA
jgi:ABC-2 type transport system permease protein